MGDLDVNCQQTIESTRNWLEQFVIEHNLCPFAARPFRENRIHFACYMPSSTDELIEKLVDEFMFLHGSDPQEVETSIIIIPCMLNDFLEYNQFLDVVDAIIDQLKLAGDIQVASFHPDYQFADLDFDDVRNFTNRSPYPMFHFIREDSIEQARNVMDVEVIPDRNMQLLLKLGRDKIRKDW